MIANLSTINDERGRDKNHLIKRMLNWIGGYQSKGKPKNRWMECVKDDDIRNYGATDKLCYNRGA